MNLESTTLRSPSELYFGELVQLSASGRGIDAILIPATAIKRKVAELGGEAALGGVARKEIDVWFFHDNSCVAYNGTLNRAFHVYGAIFQKWLLLGGMDWGVPCTEQLGTPDGVGRFGGFDDHKKSIYWKSGEAFGIWGPVRDKWASMGYETSPLGYPVTDTLPTADGDGRFNHFTNGAIYWTEETEAHAVTGQIYDHWKRMQWERSYLGYPTTDETDFPEGGRTSTFQGGGIYFWADTGAIDLRDVVVHYTGLYCYGETDWDQGTDADEPYAIISVSGPQGAATFRTKVYEDVDSGNSRPDLIEIYRGRPDGLNIAALLMEHDRGDPKVVEREVQEKVVKAYDAAMEQLKKIPIAAIVAAIVGPYLRNLMPDLGSAISDMLGLGDDTIDSGTVTLTARDMVLLATRAPSFDRWGIGFKVESPLLSGHGASYKTHYGLIPA